VNAVSSAEPLSFYKRVEVKGYVPMKSGAVVVEQQAAHAFAAAAAVTAAGYLPLTRPSNHISATNNTRVEGYLPMNNGPMAPPPMNLSSAIRPRERTSNIVSSKGPYMPPTMPIKKKGIQERDVKDGGSEDAGVWA